MSLLDRFRSDTEFDSVGHFTLDEKRAKDKMARFQLVQTEDFMLLLCQAAVAAECSRIHIGVDGALVRFIARNVAKLELEKLSRLEDFLFNSSQEALPYYLLGVARNAIGPFCCEEPVVRLEDQVLTFEVSLKTEMENLREHLQKHLLHCPCPVLFDGTALRNDPLEGSERVTLSDGYFSHLFLVRYGVVVGHKEWEQTLNFSAIVKDDRLKLDASFSGVVEDGIYKEIVDRVQTKACELFVQIVDQYVPGEGNAGPLLRRLNQKLPEVAAKALQKCPLFPLADRGEYVSFATIDKLDPLFFSVQRLNLVMDELVLLTNDAKIDSILRSVIPPHKLKDVSSEYLRKLEAQRNKEKWENSPRPTQLAPHSYLARRPVEGKAWQAEIGFLGPPGGESHLDVLVQGKLLCTETLTEVPPGTAAVLNLEELVVDEQWTRPQGRNYRTILRLLKDKINQLFNSLELKEVEQLYPRLRNYLEDLLQKKQSTVPTVALQAPLFETTEGNFLSLASLKQKERVFLGDRVVFSPRIPGNILPSELLLYSARTLKTLQQHLGDVGVLIQEQARLRELDAQLATPKAPRLAVSCSVKRPLCGPGLDGEISLHYQRLGKRVELDIFYRGTSFEKIILSEAKVFCVDAVVEFEKLVPNHDWSEFTRNQDFEDLLSRIKVAVQGLEESVLESLQTPPEYFLKLLEVYPKPVEFYWDRAIFESTAPARYYSLADLELEIKKHGELLQGPMGLLLVDRLVLLNLSKNSLAHNLLQQHLPKFTWGRAEELAKQRQIEAEFRSRPVHSDISVGGVFAFRLPLTLCRGELAFGPTEDSGEVVCYYDGRFICRKKSFLPQGCVAALDSKDLQLSEDFNQAAIPPPICDELISLCEKGLLLCAQDPSPELRHLAFSYAVKKEASEDFLQAFSDIPLFKMQAGAATSLNALAKLEKQPGFVTPSFPRQVEFAEPLLRLSPEELKLLKHRLKYVPVNLEAMLYRKEKDRKYLDTLPKELPEDCTYIGHFEVEDLSAQIGISFEESFLIGQDEEGRTLGFIPLGTLPAAALVRGAKSGKRDKADNPSADLPKAKRQLLRDWINQSYLAWVGQIHQKSLRAEERALALSTLNLTKHGIGSQQEHIQAKLAANLWSLPLFARVDGTWTSGSAVAETLQETQSPILYSDRSWRVPGSVLSLLPESKEYQILVNILGAKSLQAYQAPPLVDSEEIKRNIQQLSSWGISPLRKVGQKFVDWIESSPPKEKKEKKEKKAKPRPRAPKTSPEVIFLQEMQAEARVFLGQHHYYRSDGLFRNVELRSWVLGPPVYLAKDDKKYCFNRSNPSVRWLIETDDKQGGKTRRLVQVLLLIHWVALVNQSSKELEDQHEREFLLQLADDLRGVFS